MRKLIIPAVLGMVLLLIGCTAPVVQPPLGVPESQLLTPDKRVITVEGVGGSTTTEYNIPVITSLAEGFGVKGDTVTIKDLYPCYKGEVKLEVINGRDRTREFHLSIVPESDLQGYEQFPSEYYEWFNIQDRMFRLMPNESRVVTINISMPCDANYSGKKARCRLMVEDWSQTGLIQIAVASKWYIETY
jgi:hypothetical protein